MNYYENHFGKYLLIFISLISLELVVADTKPYFNVLEYGASGNGTTLDTKAI